MPSAILVRHWCAFNTINHCVVVAMTFRPRVGLTTDARVNGSKPTIKILSNVGWTNARYILYAAVVRYYDAVNISSAPPVAFIIRKLTRIDWCPAQYVINNVSVWYYTFGTGEDVARRNLSSALLRCVPGKWSKEIAKTERWKKSRPFEQPR